MADINLVTCRQHYTGSQLHQGDEAMKQHEQKKYRVWSYVEEYDPDAAEGSRDLGEPECLGTFDSLDQAKEYLDSVATLDPYHSLA